MQSVSILTLQPCFNLIYAYTEAFVSCSQVKISYTPTKDPCSHNLQDD